MTGVDRAAARLAGKRVLITGTAGGQGAAAKRLFARHGARVVGCDLQPGAAKATAAALCDEGYDVSGHDLDLTDPVATAAWVQESAERLGGIDVLHSGRRRRRPRTHLAALERPAPTSRRPLRSLVTCTVVDNHRT